MEESKIYKVPTAIAVPIIHDENKDIELSFKVCKRSFYCYKDLFDIEINENYYILIFEKNKIIIPLNKTRYEFTEILKTLGFKNKEESDELQNIL